MAKSDHVTWIPAADWESEEVFDGKIGGKQQLQLNKFKSQDLAPIKTVITLDQSEVGFQVTCSLLTNQKRLVSFMPYCCVWSGKMNIKPGA